MFLICPKLMSMSHSSGWCNIPSTTRKHRQSYRQADTRRQWP